MEMGDLTSVLLEHARDKIAVVDADGAYVYVNEASIDILGYDPAELVGDRVLEYVHPDDGRTVADRLAAVAAG